MNETAGNQAVVKHSQKHVATFTRTFLHPEVTFSPVAGYAESNSLRAIKKVVRAIYCVQLL